MRLKKKRNQAVRSARPQKVRRPTSGLLNDLRKTELPLERELRCQRNRASITCEDILWVIKGRSARVNEVLVRRPHRAKAIHIVHSQTIPGVAARNELRMVHDVRELRT